MGGFDGPKRASILLLSRLPLFQLQFSARFGMEGVLHMRRSILPLFVLIALPSFAARPVKVAQLEQEVASAHSRHDADAAHRISKLELTQRLGRERLEELKAQLPGEESRAALTMVADLAAFLPPAPESATADASPDADEQRTILKAALRYIADGLPRLPNFLAHKRTMRFEEQGFRDQASTAAGPMELAGSLEEQVSFDDGKEVLAPVAATGKPDHKGGLAGNGGLHTWGEFGPILSLAISDAIHNKLAWLMWEKGGGGKVAVFAFEVPPRTSHYSVDYCCLRDPGGQPRRFQTVAGYRGEIAIEPQTGAILRLQLQAGLGANEPVKSSSLLVEYGPVEIGGRTFICPRRSVAVFRIRPEMSADLSLMPGARSRLVIGGATDNIIVAEHTLINDAEFTNYHQFRSEMRVVSEPVPVKLDAQGDVH